MKVLKIHQIPGGAAVSRVRDLGRLRSLYPTHPTTPDVISAAERLGIPIEPSNQLETWNRILSILRESLEELVEVMLTAKGAENGSSPSASRGT